MILLYTKSGAKVGNHLGIYMRETLNTKPY